jgi:hypothetical protein
MLFGRIVSLNKSLVDVGGKLSPETVEFMNSHRKWKVSQSLLGRALEGISGQIGAGHEAIEPIASPVIKDEIERWERLTKARIRIGMQIGVSALVLIASVLVVVISPDAETRKWFFGTIGIVVGFWLS